MRATPDGYTLFLVSATNSFNVTLYDNLHFDLLRDMAPVASIGRDAFVMGVNPSFPAQTGIDLFPSTPSEFGKFIADYTGQWAKVIRAAGLKAE